MEPSFFPSFFFFSSFFLFIPFLFSFPSCLFSSSPSQLEAFFHFFFPRVEDSSLGGVVHFSRSGEIHSFLVEIAKLNQF